MALGGGTFTSQNKKIPGSYMNFVSAAKSNVTLSDRGIVAVGLSLNWGVDSAVFTVEKTDLQKDSLKIFGYAYTDDELKPLRDLFQYATKALIYRLNSDAKATCTYADAKYSGTRGNDLKVVIAANADDAEKFDVKTYLGTVLVDEQKGVSDAAALADNDFLDWKDSATLAVTSGTTLTGGTNATVTGTQHQAFLTAIESYSYNILAGDTTDDTTKALYVAFTKRLRDDVGIKFQTVLYGKAADYEGVINVKNSADLVLWVAGAEAGCKINASCTNLKYNGEYTISTSYTQSQLEEAIDNGELAFHKVGDEYRILTDINSLVTTTADKGDDFKSNQTMRVLDQIGNDVAALFNNKYLGKIPNDEAGRVSLWSDLVSYCKELLQLRAIENFDPVDITVAQGNTKKSVVVNSAVTPTNCMEILYMTVVVA